MIKREKVGLAFTQQTGSSTRGTRFDFRHTVRTPSFCLRYELPISRHRTSGFFLSSSFRTLGDYYAAQIKQTKHP